MVAGFDRFTPPRRSWIIGDELEIVIEGQSDGKRADIVATSVVATIGKTNCPPSSVSP